MKLFNQSVDVYMECLNLNDVDNGERSAWRSKKGRRWEVEVISKCVWHSPPPPPRKPLESM